ncbi:MAG: C25 family cysteine peptidase [Candidatus Cloacimonetes bacterium]|jgi:tetratricopeptide (TPR) repeat protein|nr:C25 family cysteine peptidase [Candidatus Cloacimonadota bacterium]
MKYIALTLVLFASLFISLNALSHTEAFCIGDLSVQSNSRGYHELRLSDLGKTGEPGNPELPGKVISFIIPANQDACNLSTSASSTYLDGTYNVMPLQTGEYYNGQSNDFTAPNPTVYSSDEFYPNKYAEIIDQSYLDGANHIVSIIVYPLRYNPVTQVVEFVNNLSISFSLTASSSQAVYPKKRFAIDASKYEAYLYDSVLNKDDIPSLRYVPDIEVTPDSSIDFNYIIVCPSDILPQDETESNPFAEFITWKECKGHRVRCMSYDEIAAHPDAGNGDDIGDLLINDLAGKVRRFLKHQWEHHGLANVLMVGGKDDLIRHACYMGAYTGGPLPVEKKYPSDLYFAEYQGSWNNDDDTHNLYGEFDNSTIYPLAGLADDVDFLQDVFIGRIILPPIFTPPVGSPTRKEAVLNWTDKVIAYEKGPGNGFDGYLDSFYSLTASDITSDASAVLVGHGFIPERQTDSFSDGTLRPAGNYVIAKINDVLPGIIVFSCHGNKGRMGVAEHVFYDETKIKNYITSLDRYLIESYDGNNDYNGLDNLTNSQKKYPIFIAASCNTGQYDIDCSPQETENPSFAEAFTTFTSGIGGPLWIGNVRISYEGPFEAKFVSNLFNEDIVDDYPNANPWCGGVSFASARYTDGGPFGAGTKHSRHYFGDPDMEIWTARPSNLMLTLDYQGKSVIVKDESGAFVQNARVVFISSTDKRVVYTDVNGQAATNIDFSTVYAHKQNHVHDAVRIIQNQETIASVEDQTLEISDKIYVPVNSTLELSGSLKLIHQATIVSDGQLIIADNTDIYGSNTSELLGDGFGNKLTVNGGLTIGNNVGFAGANQWARWDGIYISNGDVVLMQNTTFNKTPLDVNNSFALMSCCSLTLSPLTITDSQINMSNSIVLQSNLAVNNSTANFNSCDFEESNALFEASEAEYSNSSLEECKTIYENAELTIIEGDYSDSSVNIAGQLTVESTTMSFNDDNDPSIPNSITTFDTVVNISESDFTRGTIICHNLDEFSQNTNSVNIANCTIQDCSPAGILLSNIANFEITNNNIADNSTGISLVYSGHGSNYFIRNNTINSNSSNGISIIGSNVLLYEGNQIQQNNCGIVASNLSSWWLVGWEELLPGQDQRDQLVQYNQNCQIFMTYDSSPDYCAFNCIQNFHHDKHWIQMHFHNPNNPPLDIRYNYWGDNFDPEVDLHPASAFLYEPTWTPGNLEAIEESSAAALYRVAYNHEMNAEYEAAIVAYKQIIDSFPNTEYAALAVKALLRIEDLKKDRGDPSLDYTALKTYFVSEDNLHLNPGIEHIVSRLIAQTDIRIENYIDAISFYESVISNPPSSIDSLYAVIDIGHIYTLMGNSQKCQDYTGKYPELKPSNHDEWILSIDLLLNEVYELCQSSGQDVPNKVIIACNYPNPFNPSTTISFSLPSSMPCKLEIFNLRGQKVNTLVNSEMNAGNHSIIWNGQDNNLKTVSSGIYMYKITTPQGAQSSKMILMK